MLACNDQELKGGWTISFDNMFVTLSLVVHHCEAGTLYKQCQMGGVAPVLIWCSTKLALSNGPGLK